MAEAMIIRIAPRVSDGIGDLASVEHILEIGIAQLRASQARKAYHYASTGGFVNGTIVWSIVNSMNACSMKPRIAEIRKMVLQHDLGRMCTQTCVAKDNNCHVNMISLRKQSRLSINGVNQVWMNRHCPPTKHVDHSVCKSAHVLLVRGRSRAQRSSTSAKQAST